jgi:hypothetical protein
LHRIPVLLNLPPRDSLPSQKNRDDLYFPAICQFHLDGPELARITLARARELQAESRPTAKAKVELDGFRAEVEALLASRASGG